LRIILHNSMGIDYDDDIYGDQLSLFFDDDEVEEEYRRRCAGRLKLEKPTQDTGFLTCKKCALIMPDRLPEKDWTCTGCREFAEWAKS